MKNKLFVFLVVLSLLLCSCSGKTASSSNTTASGNNAAATQADTGSAGSASSADADLGSALNLVVGSDSEPSVFPSYHLEATMDTPTLSDDQTSIVNETTQMSVDVAGSNVHIFQTDPGATAQKEGFIIGDKEYKMVDGAPQEMDGQIALSWAMWQLKVVGVYAYPAYFAKKTGSDTIDGRAAEVYTFDNSDTNAASDTAMNSMGVGDLTTGTGTVWIDQKTGAMLKLDMTYTSTITNNDQKEIGKGSGSIKLEISKVGQVTVTSPVQ